MSNLEIVGLIVSVLGVGCFAAVFTILYVTYSNSLISEYKSGKKDIELIDESIYDNLNKVKKRREFIQAIKSGGFYGLMIIMIPFFALSLINKFSGNVTMIADRGLIVVATGSMSEKNPANEYIITNDLDNQFDAYSIIVIEKVERDSQLKLYDVISFVNDKGINVIHRIIGASLNSEGKIQYETRGDSNNASDTYRPTIEDIQGKYVGKHIPMVGVFVLFMQSSIGLITVASLIYCLIMIDHFTNKILKAQNERLEHLSQAIDYETETELGKMKAHYTETIYYKGISYKFNEEGFIDKEEIEDEEILEKSSDSIITIIENNDTNETITKEVPIENGEEGKEG